MFPLENEYKSILPQNAHGTYKAACTRHPIMKFHLIRITVLSDYQAIPAS